MVRAPLLLQGASGAAHGRTSQQGEDEHHDSKRTARREEAFETKLKEKEASKYFLTPFSGEKGSAYLGPMLHRTTVGSAEAKIKGVAINDGFSTWRALAFKYSASSPMMARPS